ALHRAKRFGQAPIDAGPGMKGNDAAAPWHEVHKPPERGLYGVEVFVNVRVIKLDGGKNDCIRKIMQECRTLVEEVRVVVVAFDNKVLARAEGKAGAEIFGDAADQE